MGNIYFKQGNWQLAINAYNLAIQAVEISRNWATSEDERQRTIREALTVYQNTIQAHINLGQIDKAIETSERARSRQLVDFMGIHDLYPQGKIPTQIEEYIAVTQELQQYHQSDSPTADRNLATSRSHPRIDRAAVIALETKKQTLFQQIRQQDRIAADQIEVTPIEFSTIQNLIPNSHTAILSFYTTDDDTHIFIITHDREPQIHTCIGQGLQNLQQWLGKTWLANYSIGKDIAQLNTEIEKAKPEDRSSIEAKRAEYIAQCKANGYWSETGWRSPMPDTLVEIAQRLELDTLAAKLPDITELIIIPHLSLHQIPFAALPLGYEDRSLKTNAKEAELLGERFTIRYVPSCQILQYCQERPPIDRPIHGTVEDADGTLPGAGYEGDSVAQLYEIPDRFRLRGKSQASIENYRLLLTQVNNLLSSHHASSQLDRPFESCLKLADDNITLGELLTSRYPNLNEIFLSCCETHLGGTTITDDILTLATGFLCAGARSVISTLWGVDDLATSLFSIFYYEQRKQGISRSLAIQAAQLQLRTLTKEQSEPFQSSLITYAAKIESEFKDIKKQPQNETTKQMCKELRAAHNAAVSLQERLEQYFTVDRPFADPYYWAGFTCQGL